MLIKIIRYDKKKYFVIEPEEFQLFYKHSTAQKKDFVILIPFKKRT